MYQDKYIFLILPMWEIDDEKNHWYFKKYATKTTISQFGGLLLSLWKATKGALQIIKIDPVKHF